MLIYKYAYIYKSRYTTHIYINIEMCVYADIHRATHPHTRLYSYIYMCKHRYIDLEIYIYIYIYMYISI